MSFLIKLYQSDVAQLNSRPTLQA